MQSTFIYGDSLVAALGFRSYSLNLNKWKGLEAHAKTARAGHFLGQWENEIVSAKASIYSSSGTFVMAEAIAVISFVSATCALVDYGSKVITRLNAFRKNVSELPASFHHISVQLPLLVDIVRRLNDQASQGELSAETESLLRPVVGSLHNEIEKLDVVLRKVLPSSDASTWEKGVKGIYSLPPAEHSRMNASVPRHVSGLYYYHYLSPPVSKRKY